MMIDDGNDEFNIFANLGGDVASNQTTESEFSVYWAENVAPKSVNNIDFCLLLTC
jgi:hypothetical protein